MKFTCIETSVDIFLSNHTVRLWINRDSLGGDTLLAEQITAKVRTFYNSSQMSSVEALINYAVTLPSINAVQVTTTGEGDRYGIVAYTVDFDTKG
jgi:hypothetical protein